ncbi:TetR/AcrR family transcriptional regulator [Streptomyces sp. SYSU K217416]
MARPNVEAERREQILRAACKVIADNGFRALRIADVAKEAGLSSGIVHYYFTNKRDLVHAAFEQNVARSFARRMAILESDDDEVAKLRALVDAYLPEDDETVESWHVWAELWVEAIHDADLQELNDRAYGEWRRIVAGMVRDGQAAGLIDDGDAVETANLLVAMLDGLALQVLAGSRNMTLARMRAACQSFVDRIVLSG